MDFMFNVDNNSPVNIDFITKVRYFRDGDVENWIYSIQRENDPLIKYYIMSMSSKDNLPVIADLVDPINKLRNIDTVELKQDDPSTANEYVRFKNIKKIADMSPINRFMAYREKLEEINKKR